MSSLSIIMKTVFFIAVMFITVDLVRTYNKCPKNKVIYRYIPRTFVEEQENPFPLDDVFYGMFNNPTPWIASVDVERKKKDIGENLNRYYISQI